MFLGKPSLRILLCRKDLPLAWLSSLQVPPMQPRRQQLPASQPREGDSAWPPADRQERRADRRAQGTRWWSQRLVSPPTHGAVMQRRDLPAQTCSSMKRPGLWVVVKLYVWCLQLFLTWLPHTVTILSKLIGSKKKKKEKSMSPITTFKLSSLAFFFLVGDKVWIWTVINHPEDLNIRPRRRKRCSFGFSG